MTNGEDHGVTGGSSQESGKTEDKGQGKVSVFFNDTANPMWIIVSFNDVQTKINLNYVFVHVHFIKYFN